MSRIDPLNWPGIRSERGLSSPQQCSNLQRAYGTVECGRRSAVAADWTESRRLTVRACILDLLQKSAASPGTLGDREPGKVSPRLSRSNAELLRRSHLALLSSKMKPYPDPLRSYTSLVDEPVRQAP